MNIVVIGAGAMGSIYGGRLSQHNDVTLLDTNTALVEKIREDGIILEEGGVEKCFHPSATTDAATLKKADLIILFTKSLYSCSALESVKNIIGDNTYLMTLQNGAGHEKLLSSFADSSPRALSPLWGRPAIVPPPKGGNISGPLQPMPFP